MKKLLKLTFIFSLISQSALFAQSFEFYESNNEDEILDEIPNNDTVFYEVEYGAFEECFYFLYKNVSGGITEYDLKLEIYELAEDVTAYYAYEEGEFLLNEPIDIPQTMLLNTDQELENDSLDHFRICYKQDSPGRTIYRVSYVDRVNPDITLGSIYVVFEQWFGLSLETNEINPTQIFPNPSNGVCQIEVEEAANIQVTNMLGEVVHSASLQSGTTTMDLTHLEKGVYHVSFFDPISNEYQQTKKWVVQ